MLIGDHLRTQQVAQLTLGHAQVRLPYDELVSRRNLGLPVAVARAVEIDAAFDEFGDLVAVANHGAKDGPRPHAPDGT